MLLFLLTLSAGAAPAAGSWSPAPRFAATQVSVGHQVACARTGDGGVVCWGEELGVHEGGAGWRLAGVADAEEVRLSGRLLAVRHGDGSVSQRSVENAGQPRAIAGVSGASQLVRSDGALCAVHGAGQVSCWGYGPFLAQREDPLWTAAAVEGLSGVQQLACDDWGCCAVGPEGVSCGGRQGPEGMPAGDRFRPWKAAVPAGSARLVRGFERACWQGERCEGEPYDEWGPSLAALSSAVDLALHYDQACVTSARSTSCKGRRGTVELPPLVQVELTSAASCGVDAAGAVWCWGPNDGGVLGDGSARFDPVPVKVADGASALVAVHWSTCIVQEGEWRCTGDGASSFRRVGPAFGGVGGSQYEVHGADHGAVRAIQTWGEEAKVERVSGPAQGVQLVASDRASSVYAAGDGGLHAAYSLGEGGRAGWVTMEVPGDFGAVVGLATPAVGVCALSAGGQVACWRDERFDQDADFVDAPKKAQALDLVAGLEGVEEISCGQDTLCARQGDGRVLCLGSIGMGGGGLGDAPQELPGLKGATDLASTNFHLCAVVAGEVRCVGNNGFGQLGLPRQGGEFDSGSAVAVTVPLPVRAVEVAAGQEHSCARGEDGSVWCWGSDQQGQLGRARPLELWDRAVQVRGSGAARR